MSETDIKPKYKKWADKQIERGVIWADLVSSLTLYDRLVDQNAPVEKDIFRYKTLKDLEDTLKKYMKAVAIISTE